MSGNKTNARIRMENPSRPQMQYVNEEGINVHSCDRNTNVLFACDESINVFKMYL